MKTLLQSIFIFLLLGFQTLGASQSPSAGDMPKGLWQAFSEARHMVEENKESTDGYAFRAYNPNNGYGIRFGEQGLTLKKGEWELAMALEAYGQGDDLKPVQKPELNTEGNKVTYDRGNVSEWYINGPKGLEQGFTLEQPEGFNPDKQLVLSMDLSGNLSPKWKNDGQSIAFYKDNTKAFDYDKLKAFDANGKVLTASLALQDETLQILVDAKDAQWPVTVDPIFATEQKVQGVGPLVEEGAHYGYAVDIDVDRALIGVPNEATDIGNPGAGAVYVMVRSGTEWSLEAKLTPTIRGVDQQFGRSVSLVWNQALIGAKGGITNTGQAYVFEYDISTLTWTETAALHTVSGITLTNGDGFGSSVSVFIDYLIVGAPGHGAKGDAFVFEKPGTSWIMGDDVKVPITVDDNAYFGTSVSMYNPNLILVGAPGDNGNTGSVQYMEWSSDGGDGYYQEAELVPADPEAYSYFGSEVALINGGALVGAHGDNGTAGLDQGSAYLFYGSYQTWDAGQKLTLGATARAGDHFGKSVAINGTTALIGAPNDISNPAAYVFTESDGTWTETQKLVPSGQGTGSAFGSAIAMSGTTVLVGAPSTDYTAGGANESGAAYVFDRTTGTETARLIAPTTAPLEYGLFGRSVAIDGNTAVIGQAPHGGFTDLVGEAFVFVRTGDYWEYQESLIPSDGAVDDGFGIKVALSDDTVLVGASNHDELGNGSGAAYVFVRNNSTWSQQAKLTAWDGAALDSFGSSIDIDGDMVAIGAPQKDSSAGAVYVFARNGTTWEGENKIIDSTPTANEQFGYSVALSEEEFLFVGRPGDGGYLGGFSAFDFYGFYWDLQGNYQGQDNGAEVGDEFGHSLAFDNDTLLVGAPGDDEYGTDSGKVYVYFKNVLGFWQNQAKLTASDAVSYEEFGDSVSIQRGTAVVGAATDHALTTSSGAAYLFTRSGTVWFEVNKISPSDGEQNDRYGESVALSDDTVLAGAPGDAGAGSGATGTGAAYFNRFNCGFAGPVVANRWTMFGLPCAPDASADTVEELFGDTLNPNHYYYRWVVYKRDEAFDDYVRLNPGDPILQGRGYWLLSLDNGYWDATGSLTTYPVTFAEGCSDPEGCYEITLTPPDSPAEIRYNLVGHPGNTTINWSGAVFMVNGVVYSPNRAETYGYASKNIWKYNGNGYDVYDDMTPGMEGELNSHEGIWVQLLGGSFGLTVKLLIPVNSILSDPPAPPTVMLEKDTATEGYNWLVGIIDFFIPSAQAAQPTWEQEWYLRLIAENQSEGLKDRGNVLGQLQDSVSGYDSHDLVELDPFSTPYLTIVFPHDDWGDQSGNYSSNYHEAIDYYAEDQWVFQVKSDNAYRDIHLYWEGVNLLEGIWSQNTGKRTFSKSKQADGGALLQRMWLEDMDTGERVEAVIEDPFTGAISKQSHQFNMNGLNIRTFRWVLESHNGKAPKPPKVPKVKISKKSTEFKTPPGLDRIDQHPPKVGLN